MVIEAEYVGLVHIAGLTDRMEAGTSRVEVSEVKLLEPGDDLLAFDLDRPRSGTSQPFYGLDVRGWALGRRKPAKTLVIDGPIHFLRRAAVDGVRADIARRFPDTGWSQTSGFFASIGALELEPEFVLELSVDFGDGHRSRLGVIDGRREALHSTFDPRMGAICVTSLGRSGSTALTRLLASHPDVAAYKPFLYEPRVLTYWMNALRDLAEPQAFRRQVTPHGPLDGTWWVGTEPPFPEPPFPEQITYDGLQAWMGGRSVDELADFCLSRIDGFYRQVAELTERPAAKLFVEKVDYLTAALFREVQPDVRQIFLVRDFRDAIASVFAFNDKRGFQAFGRELCASDVEYVDWLAGSVEELLHAWQRRSGDAHLIHYEDLVMKPHETVEAALHYLDLDAASTTVDAMVESLDSPDADVHRTRAPAASVGRWRRDLTAEVQEACDRSLGKGLRAFEYPT